jgi:hypothetical protein
VAQVPWLLNVVAEAGAARYLMPLWEKWLSEPPPFKWNLILGDGASGLLRSENWLQRLPVICEVDRQASDIEGFLGGRKPDALLASAGDAYPLEAASVAYVAASGGRTAQFIDTWYNYARRFGGSKGLQLPERILVIDERAREAAVNEGLPEERLMVVGQPWWERTPVLPPQSRRKVLFLGAPVRRDYGDSLGYDEWDAWRIVVEASRRQPDLFDKIWYGKHPEQVDLAQDAIGQAELTTNSMSVLPQAGTVLGMFSSPMVDAYLGGAAVISVQPNLIGADRCPLSRYGYIARAGSVQSLIDALQQPATQYGQTLRQALHGSTAHLDRFVREYLLP